MKDNAAGIGKNRGGEAVPREINAALANYPFQSPQIGRVNKGTAPGGAVK